MTVTEPASEPPAPACEQCKGTEKCMYYGISHPFVEINSVDGVPRKNDATPEGIVLKAEDPQP